MAPSTGQLGAESGADPARVNITPALWNFYDLYKTSLLSCKYYGRRLARFRFYSKVMEIAVALGTSGALASWVASAGNFLANFLWPWFLGFSTILATVKPILGLDRQIERYSKLHNGYSSHHHDLDEIKNEIEVTQEFTEGMKRRAEESRKRLRYLTEGLEEDPKPNKRLLKKCFEEVNKEVPAERFWIPQNHRR